MVTRAQQSEDAAFPPRLTVGILIPSAVVPRWVGQVIEDVIDASFADPVIVVLPPHTGPRGGLIARARGGLFRAYRSVDARLFRRARDPLAPVALGPRLAGLRQVALVPGDPRGDALQAEDLDVLLDLVPVADPRTLASAARHGVWSLRHGDGREPPLFWDVYDGSTVSGTFLEAIRDPSGPALTLWRSYSATDPISLRRNRDPAYWKSARFPVRLLRELHRNGWERIAAAPTDGSGARVGAAEASDRHPSSAETVRYAGRVARRALGRQLRSRAFYEEWFLAFREREGSAVPAEMHGFRVVDSPPGRWYADPFVVEHAGRHHVFFEDFGLDDRRGRISVAELGPAGLGAPSVALETPYHLSYPSVFEWDGELYLLPESAANRTIELYRAVRYPDVWEPAGVLMEDVVALDTTLLRHDGRVWLFANLPVPGAKVDDELCLFSSDSIHGEWTPHPRNPIVSDVRCARPAGEILQAGGQLIRPAQDGSGAYGSAVVFRRIDVLTEDDYRESTVGRIDAGWLKGNLGTHTYNRDARFEVIDGRRLRRRRRPGR